MSGFHFESPGNQKSDHFLVWKYYGIGKKKYKNYHK
jgi:hypothetical protein